MAFETSLFYILSSFALTCGIMVVSSRNPVHSVLFLILVFCNVSGLLLLLEAEFLALIFIIVYVGAIAVLFLFVVMMLNVKLSELNESILRYFPVGGLLAFIFFCEIGFVLINELVPTLTHLSNVAILNDLHHYRPNLFPWNTIVLGATSIQLFGNVLYTKYLYSFLISSIILLVSMIGAIVLTLHKRLSVKRQDIFKQVTTDFDSVIKNYA